MVGLTHTSVPTPIQAIKATGLICILKPLCLISCFQAHSGVLGLTFYTGSMFPQAYRGDAFVAMHGSWNRSKRTGYKVVRIHFQNNRPVGGYDDFVVGWMLSEDKREVWGRPSGLLVMKDGSMLIADDGANKIWRITYHEPTP